MHFLKCNNCGHLNEVRTEYLTFCKSCQKKIDNNFQEWIKRNPDKSFQDFKSLICISESEINRVPEVKKQRPRSLKFWIGFIITLSIATIAGQFFGDKIIEFLKFGHIPKDILHQKWHTEYYGKDGLIVETPFVLSEIELPLLPETKQYMEDVSSYMSKTSKGFAIAINSIRYKPEAGKLDLHGAANGSVSEMKMQPGISDFVYSEDFTQDKDTPAFHQTGTYIQDKVKIEFINAGFMQNRTLFQVTVLYRSDDPNGKAVAERVIRSVRFEKKKNIS
jgi:hypothetical protein